MTIQDSPFCCTKLFADKKLHLGISGSVACYKSADLLRAWQKIGIHISATLSNGARRFISPLLMQALGADPVYGEMFGTEVFGHLEPGRQTDCMAIVPASADIIAKMAAGIADEMLCAQYTAYNGPCVLAPAMNPAMWAHAATQTNVLTLKKRACQIVEPGVGGSACGDEGQGRLAELPEIFLAILRALSPQDMAQRKIMVTLGPTREPWDGVRFWSNSSSGKMGAALVTAAWLRGANVTAICGPGINVFLPATVKRENVQTATEMYEAACAIWPTMDFGAFSAAVADFAPVCDKKLLETKFKKGTISSNLAIQFSRNRDILATLADQKKTWQKILGFAAEITPDLPALLPHARAKLNSKKADIIAANRINKIDGTFGANNAEMAVVDTNGNEEIWSPLPKSDIAWNLLSWLLKM